MRFRLTLLLCLCFSLFALAQSTARYVDTDVRIMQIPKSSTRTVEDIATYIKANFSTDEEKARAAFYWISQTISYDIASMNSTNYYENEQQVVDEVMKSRKGVCMHYATLMSWICNRVGVKTFVVGGYTRQNGKVDILSHAWNVSFVNGKWQIIDPTWGTGQIVNGKFVRQLNNEFFLIQPEEGIKSHCPFDPMWQLLQYPIDNNNFSKGIVAIDKSKPLFSFNDSIAAYEKADELTRQKAALRRMENNGINSILLQENQHQIKNRINSIQKNTSIETFNNAVNTLNQAVNDLNEFINYRNKQFTPKRSDAALKLMLENVETILARYKTEVAGITYADAGIKYSLSEINKTVQSLEEALAEQRTFLDKYLSTAKIFRKSLFYNYNWMGIPLHQNK